MLQWFVSFAKINESPKEKLQRIRCLRERKLVFQTQNWKPTYSYKLQYY